MREDGDGRDLGFLDQFKRPFFGYLPWHVGELVKNDMACWLVGWICLGEGKGDALGCWDGVLLPRKTNMSPEKYPQEV